MRRQALGTVIAAAVMAYLTGALAAGARADTEGLRNTALATSTHMVRSVSGANPTALHATSYRPDGSDSGPPTPGPTDPNGPSS
jgi:hypothetical protein